MMMVRECKVINFYRFDRRMQTFFCNFTANLLFAHFHGSVLKTCIMARHNELGKWGEQIAADIITAKGYAIVERNWRLGHYEIDIIAMHANRVVFIEVKTRSNPIDDPLSAVDARRIRRLSRAAHIYLTTRELPHEFQFDIITVSGTPDNYSAEHIEDAFFPPLTTYR